MKAKILLFFVLFTLGVNAQEPYIKFNIFEPFTATEFGSIIVAQELSNIPRLFSLEIEPEGKTVWVDVVVNWKKPGKNNFEQLFKFNTKPFIAKTIYNDEMDTYIEIEYTKNEGLIEDNILLGKPAGNYEIYVQLHNKNGTVIATDFKELEFLNPAQTLTIQSPVAEENYDAVNVLASWDDVVGVEEYFIKANVRKNNFQSLDEALNSGNPLIREKSVGSQTTVNLRDYLDKEWLPGEEIVFQVYGSLSGPGQSLKLYSQIVNFYLRDDLNFGLDESTQPLEALAETITSPDERNVLFNFLSGEYGDILNVSVDGKYITSEELLEILNSLKLNPDRIVRVEFKEEAE